jgi:hypothetical protein
MRTMLDRTLCVPNVTRYAGGKTKLVRRDGSYVIPHPAYPPDVQRQISAIPATNTMRFIVTATVTDSRCLECGTTEPNGEQPGGDEECLAQTDALDQCVVQDLQTGTTWSGPCNRLVDRNAPPGEGPSPLLMGLRIAAVIGVGVGIGALLASGRK